MVEWIIEAFAKHHDRSNFSCGRPTLDDFIRARVSQYEKRRLGRTFVAVRVGEKQVIAYYTLAAGAVAFESLPPTVAGKLPKHPVSIVLLARLAVDQSEQGKRLGEGLLLDALQSTLDLSASLGIHAVKVEALDDSAAAFYCRYGFTALVDTPLQLYLPLATIEDLLA